MGFNRNLQLGYLVKVLMDAPTLLFYGRYGKDHLVGEYLSDDIPEQYHDYIIKRIYVSNTGEVIIIMDK